MEKLNIAELLKDCPKGMELDCAIYENVELDYIEQTTKSTYPIHCLMKTNGGYNAITFTNNGCSETHPNAKCVIFPKGKTTWEGFQRPFKDGDVVATVAGTWVGITLGGKVGDWIPTYCVINSNNEFMAYFDQKGKWSFSKLATEEEKQKLFDAIKANGYVWNAETKTLEKLIKPKFKVGDKIVKRNSVSNSWIVSSVNSEYYGLKLPLGGESFGVLSVSEQDDYELLLNTNKFDITTLKPFDKVLVRDKNKDEWAITFFSHCNNLEIYKYSCINNTGYAQCIPYEGNKHLLGTTNDCDDYYKTWE